MGKPCAVAGALAMCSFGVAPGPVNVLPSRRVLAAGRPAGVIADSLTGANLSTFGMCTSLANPSVASATAAALGVLTPMPCVPVAGPWTPGSPTVLIGGLPALTMGSTCQCAFGGVVSLLNPGQMSVLAG